MVRLLRAGEPVKMSKRSGSFVTLAEVVEEVGKDVVRFTMLTRKPDAQMDFDFAKVVEASKDNPVFYVQYAHARIRSLQRRAAEAGLEARRRADLAPARRRGAGAGQARRPVPAHRRGGGRRRTSRTGSPSTSATSPRAFHALWNRGNDDPSRRFLIEDNPELTARGWNWRPR